MKKVILLGVDGCPTCARLNARVQVAIRKLGVVVDVQKITEPEQIMEYNAGGLPAVFVDGKLMSARRVPEIEELITWLREGNV